VEDVDEAIEKMNDGDINGKKIAVQRVVGKK
jgi:RNA recognition motif-containing protein